MGGKMILEELYSIKDFMKMISSIMSNEDYDIRKKYVKINKLILKEIEILEFSNIILKNQMKNKNNEEYVEEF